MNPGKLDFQNYNTQFDSFYTSGDLDSCFALFMTTPYAYDSFDFYMLEKLSSHVQDDNTSTQTALITKYISALESAYNVHTMMIIASLVEDILSNTELRKEVWKKVMAADLTDKVLIKELFFQLGVKENPGLCFELFQKYPDYGLLSELWSDYKNHYSETEKDMLLENYSSILNSGDTSSKKVILYSLWVDFFEDFGTQEEAWNKLLSKTLTKEAIKGLLEYSGPVAFSVKLNLIRAQIDDSEMHPSILDCLFGSLHDVCGNISFPDARIIVKQLSIDSSNERYTHLADSLYKFNSREEYWNDRNKKNNSTG